MSPTQVKMPVIAAAPFTQETLFENLEPSCPRDSNLFEELFGSESEDGDDRLEDHHHHHHHHNLTAPDEVHDSSHHTVSPSQNPAVNLHHCLDQPHVSSSRVPPFENGKIGIDAPVAQPQELSPERLRRCGRRSSQSVGVVNDDDSAIVKENLPVLATTEAPRLNATYPNRDQVLGKRRISEAKNDTRVFNFTREALESALPLAVGTVIGLGRPVPSFFERVEWEELLRLAFWVVYTSNSDEFVRRGVVLKDRSSIHFGGLWIEELGFTQDLLDEAVDNHKTEDVAALELEQKAAPLEPPVSDANLSELPFAGDQELDEFEIYRMSSAPRPFERPIRPLPTYASQRMQVEWGSHVPEPLAVPNNQYGPSPGWPMPASISNMPMANYANGPQLPIVPAQNPEHGHVWFGQQNQPEYHCHARLHKQHNHQHQHPPPPAFHPQMTGYHNNYNQLAAATPATPPIVPPRNYTFIGHIAPQPVHNPSAHGIQPRAGPSTQPLAAPSQRSRSTALHIHTGLRECRHQSNDGTICRAMVDRVDSRTHFAIAHGYKLPAKSKEMIQCRWEGCTESIQWCNYKKHIDGGKHFGFLLAECPKCGEKLSTAWSRSRHDGSACAKKRAKKGLQ
ncbi:hypothetical protein VNI00_015647 [Paramarasmius palmivorus]|uniref:C2H2-type domain-containing protein n=1 Tax=Paramarasmius palmivorus TaxID=297713 RepID=A0AAW0BJ04_9AGAR